MTDDCDEPDDPHDPEPEPPDTDRVGKRALVVTFLSWRAFLEQHAGDERVSLDHVPGWLESAGLDQEFEPDERRLALGPLGSWGNREVVDASWGIEGAVVLAWALRLIDLPPHDQQVDPAAVAEALGLFSPAPPARSAPTLRPMEEIDWQLRRLLGLHWRMRNLLIDRGPVDFLEFARHNWYGGFDPTGIPLADGDLAVGGSPVTRVEPEQVQAASSIAHERHRAVNWLAGYDPLWSEVDTST